MSLVSDNKITSTKLDFMQGGWFVGDFDPSLYKTRDVEVAVKHYKKGDSEKRHYHKVATEFTVVVKGMIDMDGRRYGAGEIIKVPAGVSTNFEALEDSITTVVKLPGAVNDKYLGES